MWKCMTAWVSKDKSFDDTIISYIFMTSNHLWKAQVPPMTSHHSIELEFWPLVCNKPSGGRTPRYRVNKQSKSGNFRNLATTISGGWIPSLQVTPSVTGMVRQALPTRPVCIRSNVSVGCHLVTLGRDRERRRINRIIPPASTDFRAFAVSSAVDRASSVVHQPV